MTRLRKRWGVDKKNGMIKERNKTPGIMGLYPTFFTKVGSRFRKIPIMRYYQGGTQKFWEDGF